MGERVKLTTAQISALEMVERRDWPAGYPRIDWLNKATARVLVRHGLIEELPQTGTVWRGNIVSLTDAGRAALSHHREAQGGDRG